MSNNDQTRCVFCSKKYYGRHRFSSLTKHPTGTGCRFLQEKGVTLDSAEAKKIKDKIKYGESVLCGSLAHIVLPKIPGRPGPGTPQPAKSAEDPALMDEKVSIICKKEGLGVGASATELSRSDLSIKSELASSSADLITNYPLIREGVNKSNNVQEQKCQELSTQLSIQVAEQSRQIKALKDALLSTVNLNNKLSVRERELQTFMQKLEENSNDRIMKFQEVLQT